jgi:hypothetical protein
MLVINGSIQEVNMFTLQFYQTHKHANNQSHG